MILDVNRCREHFPALQRPKAPIYLDNPAGTQVAREVLESMHEYLLHDNANTGGAFATSQRSDAMLREARAAMADFLGAPLPAEIVFGANMTTLTFALSRAIGRTLRAGDEIVVTHLDHDANIAPWLSLAERGAAVRWVDVHLDDCTLDLDSLARVLGPRTKLVAVGYTSNAVGTVHDIGRVIRMAHAAGALVFVDAVHQAPHGPIDVGDLDCDFLVCSAYKFFGPHVGILWGRFELLDALPAYKVRPAGERPPDRFESGTLNHEGIAGVLGALRYLEGLGTLPGGPDTRRGRLHAAMSAIRNHERGLSAALLDGLGSIPGLRLWGLEDPARLHERVPTFSFTLDGRSPREVAEALGTRGIQVWDGDYYAVAIMEKLGLHESGGTVRVGAVHYNTAAEIAVLVEALRALASRS